jgi:hypothetical protein
MRFFLLLAMCVSLGGCGVAAFSCRLSSAVIKIVPVCRGPGRCAARCVR